MASQWVLAAGVGFAFLLCVLVGLYASNSRQAAIQREEDLTRSLSLTYEAYTQQALVAFEDIVLEMNLLEDQEEEDGEGDAPDTLREHWETNPLVLDLVVVTATDEGGPRITRRISRALPKPVLDDLIVQSRELPIVVSRPFLSPALPGRWAFAVAHAAGVGEGEEERSGTDMAAGPTAFSPLAVVIVDLGQFAAAFASILESDQASVALAHTDGYLMLRVPDPGNATGQVLDVLRRSEVPVGSRVSGLLVSPIDGLERVYTRRRVGEYPMVIYVTVALEQALAGWTDSMVLAAGLVVLLLLGDGALTYAVLRQLARRRAWMAEISLRNTLLSAQQQTSPDGILAIDLEGRIVSWNQRFLDLWDMPEDAMTRGDGLEVHALMSPFLKDPEVFKGTLYTQINDPTLAEDGVEVRLLNGRVFERFSRGLGDEGARPWGRVWFYRDVTDRRRAEDALRASERRYRAMFDGVADGLLVLNTAGTILDGNQAGLRMIGATVEDVGGLSLKDRTSGRDAEGINSFLTTVGVAGDHMIEVDLAGPGGSVFRAEIRGVRFDVDERQAVLAVVRDITVRRRNEAALRASEKRFRDVADSVGELIYEVDPQFTFTYVSGRAHAQLGRDAVNLLGDVLFSLIDPRDRASIRSLLTANAEGRAPFSNLECRVLRHGGEVSWQRFSGVPTLDEHGRLTGFRGACMDVTEIKVRELEMAEANAKLERQAQEMAELARRLEVSREDLLRVQERFDLAMRGTNDGIWDWDLLTDEVYYSSRWKEMLGLAEDDLGSTLSEWTERVHPNDLSAALADMKQHLAGHTPLYRNVHRMRHENGQWVWILDRGRALRDHTGRAVRLVATHTDITEMRAYEQALEEAKEKAEAADRAKSQFLAVMSHEIRTPMTGVLGMGELLLSSQLTEEQERFARILMRSARTLLGLLNDVLDVSKIEAGQLTLEVLDFAPGVLVSDVIGLFQPKASEKGLRLTTEGVDDDLPVLRGDPMRLRQVLFNLVSNAVKFTEKGQVTVAIACAPADGEGRHRLELMVTDTGIGLSEDQKGRLFTPFSQADLSTTRRFGGTGLGLTICKRLIELMGGTVAVDSTVGQGARFRVTVDLPEGDPEEVVSLDGLESMVPVNDEAVISSGYRILLAEDNETNRLLIETVLRRHGHAVEAVADGRAAVEVAEVAPFDLILMDMQMPEMDGPTATREIRKGDGPCARAPIVALTADARPEDRERYMAAGLTELLTKPVDWGRLEEVIQTLVNKAPGTGTSMMLDSGSEPTTASTGGGEAPAASPEDLSFLGEPVHDPSVVEGLIAQVGKARFAPLLTSVIGNLDRHRKAVAGALSENDAEDIRAKAHALKGVSGQFGAKRAAAICLAIEQASQDPEVARRLGPALDEAIDGARAALKAFAANPEQA